jgi:hypothetical protein
VACGSRRQRLSPALMDPQYRICISNHQYRRRAQQELLILHTRVGGSCFSRHRPSVRKLEIQSFHSLLPKLDLKISILVRRPREESPLNPLLTGEQCLLLKGPRPPGEGGGLGWLQQIVDSLLLCKTNSPVVRFFRGSSSRYTEFGIGRSDAQDVPVKHL